VTAAVTSSTSRAPQVRVLVIDDQAAYRDAVTTVVDTESGFELVAALASASGVNQVIDDTRPDLVLLDVRMPDEDGAALAVELRRDHPSLTVLLMSVFSSDEIPCEVFAAGVQFVEKENFGAEILLRMRIEVERNRSVA